MCSIYVLWSVLFIVVSFVFFFQAEDGIRDRLVTGVQTCALPIFLDEGQSLLRFMDRHVYGDGEDVVPITFFPRDAQDRKSVV